MFRAPFALRHALVAAMALVAPAGVGAQTATLDFNALTDPAGAGIVYVPNCYTELGYTVTVVGVACSDPYALATAGPSDPLLYTGSPALFLNDPSATMIDFTRSGGGMFDFQQMQFAPFLGANTTVTLTGFRLSGPSIFATIMVPGTLTGLQSFTTAAFTGLTSLRLSAVNQFGEPIVQFDNVRFAAAAVSPVPEPATFGLMVIGLVGVGAVARRRRAA